MTQPNKIRRPSHYDYPIILSRNTDVAHWYLDWLKQSLQVGYFIAPDPKTAIPVRWSTYPTHVPVLYFMTKHPVNLIQPLQSWLLSYRVAVSVTITGWESVEHAAPGLDEQLEGMGELAQEIGVGKVKWRYSPIPVDLNTSSALQDRLSKTAQMLAEMGFEEVEMSTLLPSPHYSEEYKDRRAALRTAIDIASQFGFKVGLCANDTPYVEKTEACETTCVDSERLNKVFGLDLAPKSITCGCQRTIDPCNGSEFGCGSGCEYCYVPETNVGGCE